MEAEVPMNEISDRGLKFKSRLKRYSSKKKPSRVLSKNRFNLKLQKALHFRDPLTIIQEMGINPSYEVLRLNHKFKVELSASCGIYTGYGSNMKEAKRNAAQLLLNNILKESIETAFSSNGQSDTNSKYCDIQWNKLLPYMASIYLQHVIKINDVDMLKKKPQNKMEESDNTIEESDNTMEETSEMIEQTSGTMEHVESREFKENSDLKCVIQLVHQRFPEIELVEYIDGMKNPPNFGCVAEVNGEVLAISDNGFKAAKRSLCKQILGMKGCL